MTTQRRAIGIIRVSQVAGREGESFVSPGEQRKRIEQACERDGLQLVAVLEELDVSGGKALEARPGLSEAVRRVEAGAAEVVVAAYFDRLFRSLSTQAEVVERVEAAGGQVLAVDVGRVTGASAGQWLSSTMLGAVAEYARRTTRERVGASVRDAIARGVAPWPRVTCGYRRGPDKRYVPDPQIAPAVREGFEMRANGATVEQVWEHLRARGADITCGGVRALLASRVVLGEIHFGDHEPNLHAHEPILARPDGMPDRELWEAVQRIVVPGGRKSKSERLLARLGLAVCGSCGARLVVGHSFTGGRRYPFYRCGSDPTQGCPCRATIAAERLERCVVDHVRTALEDVEGRASAETAVRDAEVALKQAQDALDNAIRAFAALADEPAAVERLTGLRGERDAARERLEALGPGAGDALTVSASRDWDSLGLDLQRAIVRATVARVTVRPGRDAPEDRVTVELVG